MAPESEGPPSLKAPTKLFKNEVLTLFVSQSFTHFTPNALSFTLSAMADDDSQDVADRDRIFKRFDTNGDGKISAAELGESLKLLGQITAEEVQSMMDEMDTDKDGFISYEEFTEFAKANRGLVRDVAKIF